MVHRMNNTFEPSDDLGSLADELGEVRKEIQTLKARADALRGRLLEARANGPVSGRSFQVTVRKSSSRRFDRKLLPDEIQNDPQYWRTVETVTVVSKPLEDGGEDDDFDLIEPF